MNAGRAEDAADNTRACAAMFDIAGWRYFLRFIRMRGMRLLVLSCAGALRSLLLVPILLMTREIFDVAIPRAEHVRLFWLAGGIVAARLLYSAVLILMRHMVVRHIQRVMQDLRGDLVGHLYRLNRAFHIAADRNGLHARIVQDTARVDQLSNALFSAVIPAGVTSVVLVALLFVLQWRLTLLACLILPLIWLTNRHAGAVVRRRVAVFQQAFEQFSKGIHASLQRMGLTQEQGAAAMEVARREAELADLGAKSQAMATGFLLNGQLNETLMNAAGIALLVAGALAIMDGTMTMGDFVAFYAAAGLLNGQLGSLAGSLPDLLSGNEALRKLRQLREADAMHPYEGRRVLDFAGTVAFENVSFGYGGNELLRNVDFRIRPGEIVLIAGANGAGKSTMLQLLLGFWRPSSGRLLADGMLYDELDMIAFRQALGFVPQRPEIVAGSIQENLCYGRPTADGTMAAAAAALSGADEFIARLPDGMQTQVGEDGGRLSGGERQKLAIARAIVARPRLLILDEPTNHLVSTAMTEILGRLRERYPDSAILIVSHDRDIATCADRVLVLRDGSLHPVHAP